MSGQRYIVEDRSAVIPVREFRQYLYLGDDDSFDNELSGYILAAQDYVAGKLGKEIGELEIKYFLSDLPATVILPWFNATNIRLFYLNSGYAPVEIEDSDYTVHNLGMKGMQTLIKLSEAVGDSYRSLMNKEAPYPAYIKMRLCEPVEASVKQAVMMAAAELFNARTETMEVQRHRVSITVDRLLRQHRKVIVQ